MDKASRDRAMTATSPRSPLLAKLVLLDDRMQALVSKHQGMQEEHEFEALCCKFSTVPLI